MSCITTNQIHSQRNVWRKKILTEYSFHPFKLKLDEYDAKMIEFKLQCFYVLLNGLQYWKNGWQAAATQ